MIYKYCPPTEHSLANLQSCTLLYRHYGSFNDPFEFWSRLVHGVPTDLEKERLHAALREWGFPEESHDPDLVQESKEYFESLEDSQPRFRDMYDNTRIACFGTNDLNLLLWSHYADGLRGFCIAFDEKELIPDPDLAYLAEVEYLDAPPLVDAFVYAMAEDQYDFHMTCIDEIERREAHLGGNPEQDAMYWSYKTSADEAMTQMQTLWRRAFAAKPQEWSYENEKRLLIRVEKDASEAILQTYPVAALRELIVGERMESEYLDRLLETVRTTFGALPIRKAARSRDSFSLELQAYP